MFGYEEHLWNAIQMGVLFQVKHPAHTHSLADTSYSTGNIQACGPRFRIRCPSWGLYYNIRLKTPKILKHKGLIR